MKKSSSWLKNRKIHRNQEEKHPYKSGDMATLSGGIDEHFVSVTSLITSITIQWLIDTAFWPAEWLIDTSFLYNRTNPRSAKRNLGDYSTATVWVLLTASLWSYLRIYPLFLDAILAVYSAISVEMPQRLQIFPWFRSFATFKAQTMDFAEHGEFALHRW